MRYLSIPLILLSFCPAVLADIAYSTPGSTYTQNFNTLAAGSAGTPNASNIAWANDSTLPGWSLFNSTGAAITTYGPSDGNTTTGSFFAMGAGGNSDRALGGIASGGAYFGSPSSGALAGYLTFAVKNSTGGNLDSFALSFNGEQWRNGGNASAQTMALQYGFGATFAGVSTWNTPGGNFDWSSPVVGATAAAVNGNSAGLVSGKGGTISNLTWMDGSTLWIRWIENNDAGNDHGLAIDDLSFSATLTAVPEASPVLLGSMICGVVGLTFGGRKLWRKASAA